MRTRRLAPTFAPSGAKTELHESMKDCVSEPPHDSPPALRSLTPDSVAELSCWKLVNALGCTDWPTEAMLDSGTSAPAAVRTS